MQKIMRDWGNGIDRNAAVDGYMYEEYKDLGFDSSEWSKYKTVETKISRFQENFTTQGEC